MKKLMLLMSFLASFLCLWSQTIVSGLEKELNRIVENTSIQAEFADVVFSEIMAKPSGSNPEFVEFYNRSDKVFNLKNWKFHYLSKGYNIPEAEIKPGTYFVLCKTGVTHYFGKEIFVIGVPSFPTLANAGKLLQLSDNLGNLVHWFEYSEKMYGDENKEKQGGWSLECIDLENKGNMVFNWAGAMREGGTPGEKNSIRTLNPDDKLAYISSVSKLEGDTIAVAFSKPMNLNLLKDVESYEISKEGYEIRGQTFDYPKGTILKFLLYPMPQKGESVDLYFPGFRDLSGFPLADMQYVTIASGWKPDSLDIVINELLSNPLVGSNEYVELYNRSDRAIDLSYLSIATRKSTDGSLNKDYELTSIPRLLYPRQYVVITKSRKKVTDFYRNSAKAFIIELPVMPLITNASGSILILNKASKSVIDEFVYSEKMHHEAIVTKKGVALERIDYNGLTNNFFNWISASSDSGYGTPGYTNSQSYSLKEGNRLNVIALENDTYQINYNFIRQGNRCRIIVFDILGQIVRQIANNDLLGTQGSFFWDGKDFKGQTLYSGIYFISMKAISINGEEEKYYVKLKIR